MADLTHQLVPALRVLLSSARADSDTALLERFVTTRDELAFDELMRRHGPMVLGVSRRVTRDAHAAEDVFQATFLLLARKAQLIRRAEGLGAWLHRTAFRLALRSRKLGRAVEATRPRPSTDASPLDTLTARELVTILDEELSGLPEEYRAAVVACSLEGLSLEEAACRLGWTTGSVKGRLERGRARLRQRLEARGLTLPGAMAAPLFDARALPGTVLRAAREAALGGAAKASVLTLIDGGVPAMSATKLSLVGAMLLLCGVLALGATLRDDRAAEAAPPVPVVTKPEPVPEGARLRLGTLERRAVGMQLAVTADGKSIIGVTQARKWVTEWDFRTGKLRERRAMDTYSTGGLVVLSPDGRWVLMDEHGDKPGDVRLVIWDTQTCKPVQTIRSNGAFSSLPLVAFSRDGQRLAVASHLDGKMRVSVWDWRRGEPVLMEAIEGYDCYQAAFSPDGTHLLVSMISRPSGIYCWDIAAKKLLWQSTGHLAQQLVVTPAGKVVSAEWEKRVERDLRTGAITATLRLPTGVRFPHLAVTRDGTALVESGGGEAVVVWDLQTGKGLYELPEPWAVAAVSPDGKSVLTNNGSMQRWDLTTGKPVYPDVSPKGHLDEVKAIAFTADGTRLVAGAADGSVGVWDTTTGKPVRLWRQHPACQPSPVPRLGIPGGVEALDVTPDGRTVVSVGRRDRVRVWDVGAGKESRSAPLAEPINPRELEWVYHLRLGIDGRDAVGLLAPDNCLLLGYQTTGRLVRWDFATGKTTTVLEAGKLVTSRGAIDPEGRRFINAGQVFDTRTGHPVGSLEEYPVGSVVDAVFSPDGLQVAGAPTWPARQSGREPKGPALRVWEAATGKVIARLSARVEEDEKVIHPTGRYVAFHDRYRIYLWDLRTEKEVRQWPMPRENSVDGYRWVSTFAFSPEGTQLATGHLDGTILLWDVKLPESTPTPLRPKELDALWVDLRDDNARKAYLAAWRLAEFPREAVAFLRSRVKPVQPAGVTVTGPLIADLDGDTQAKRDTAMTRLRELGQLAEPALREAMKAPASAEQKRRLQQLVAALEKLGTLSADQLRDLRAVQVLGWMNTPDARMVLQVLAEGNAPDPVTCQAKAALARRN